MNGSVVVDASLAVKWLLEEDDSDSARARATVGRRGNHTCCAHLMPVEVANVLHRRVVRGELTVEAAVRLLETLLASGVELRDTPGLNSRALELAGQLQQGAVYDAHYLALAESLDCDLWTADARFFRAASRGTVTVNWIGQFRQDQGS